MYKACLLLSTIVLVAGCGTVTRGTKQGVKFNSEPAGASVTVVRSKKVETQWNCTAPCELQLSRKRDFDVTFELDGYKPVSGRLASRIGAKGGATGIAGNAVLGGGIGFIVDAGTGANMQLKPDPMRAVLAPINSDKVSMIPDIRVEGGGTETVVSENENTLNPTGFKRLPRPFGAEGVTMQLTDSGSASDSYGVKLTAVSDKSAAAEAGLQIGDIVTKVNDHEVATLEDIVATLSTLKSGDEVPVILLRDSDNYETTLAL